MIYLCILNYKKERVTYNSRKLYITHSIAIAILHHQLLAFSKINT